MAKHLKASIGKRAFSGAIAGVIGGLTHAAMNEVDRKILNYNADDLVLLGGVFTSDTALARKIGIGMHLNFAAIFGATYAVLLQPKTDREAFRQGVTFAMTEHFGLFPLGILVDQFHPHIQRGTSERFFTPTSFVEASLRHLALGAGLGASYPHILRKVSR